MKEKPHRTDMEMAIMDIMIMLDKMEYPFQRQIDKYDEIIAQLNEMLEHVRGPHIKEPCPKCGKTMTWHEKKVGYCFTCHPHEPSTNEAEKEDRPFAKYRATRGDAEYPTKEIPKGILRRHSLDRFCVECYQAMEDGLSECPKCHYILPRRSDEMLSTKGSKCVCHSVKGDTALCPIHNEKDYEDDLRRIAEEQNTEKTLTDPEME